MMKNSLFKYKNRNAYLDVGKFFAIWIIVIIHVLQRTIPGFTSSDGWGARMLLLLGVSPFFFLSGIAYRYKKTLSPLGFLYDIIRRAFLYFLPFVWFICFRIWFYEQWPSFYKAWDELMLYPVSGLWCCWILLWLVLVLDIGLLISYLKPKLKVLFVSITIIIGYVTLIILRNSGVIEYDHSIGYDYFIIYTPVFLLGYLIGPYIHKLNKVYIHIICMIIGISGLVPLCIYNPDFITTKFVTNTQWLMHLATLCSVIFYIGLIPLLLKIKWSNVLAYLGQYTLQIYFLHLILLKNWSSISLDNAWLIALVSIGLVLLCFLNSYLVVFISACIPFAHFILFGKHFSIYQFEDKFFNAIKNFCYSFKCKKTRPVV